MVTSEDVLVLIGSSEVFVLVLVADCVGVAVAVAVWLSSPPAVVELSDLIILVVGAIVIDVDRGEVDAALPAANGLIIVLLLLILLLLLLLLFCETTLADDSCTEAMKLVLAPGNCSVDANLGEFDIVVSEGDEVASGSTTLVLIPAAVVVADGVVVGGPTEEAIVSGVACSCC